MSRWTDTSQPYPSPLANANTMAAENAAAAVAHTREFIFSLGQREPI